MLEVVSTDKKSFLEVSFLFFTSHFSLVEFMETNGGDIYDP